MTRRYSVERKLGAGGSGTVYLGWRLGPEGFRRRVAIKRPHADLISDPAGRRATLREAALASRIHHAHVVSVVDVLVEDDDISLILEYVDGASLAELLDASVAGRTAPLPPRVAIRILLDACAGLAALHEHADETGPHKLLHQDVSPQNVLVGRDGVARVSDLGLARAAEATATRSAGSIVGKLGYLAPEVLEGTPFSESADLYAIGVVAWEGLAQRRLFSSGTSEIEVRRAARGAIPPLRSVVADLPAALERAVASALEREPSRRPSSVRAFAVALEHAARAADWVGTHVEVGAWVERASGKLQPSSVHTPTLAPSADKARGFGVTASITPWAADDEPTPIVDEITGLAAEVTASAEPPPPISASAPAAPPDRDDAVGRTTVKMSTAEVMSALPELAPLATQPSRGSPASAPPGAVSTAVPVAWPGAAAERPATRRRAVVLALAAGVAASILVYAAISSRRSSSPEAASAAAGRPSTTASAPSRSASSEAPSPTAPLAEAPSPPPPPPAEPSAVEDDIEILEPVATVGDGSSQRPVAAKRSKPTSIATAAPAPTASAPLPPENPYRKKSPTP